MEAPSLNQVQILRKRFAYSEELLSSIISQCEQLNQSHISEQLDTANQLKLQFISRRQELVERLEKSKNQVQARISRTSEYHLGNLDQFEIIKESNKELEKQLAGNIQKLNALKNIQINLSEQVKLLGKAYEEQLNNPNLHLKKFRLLQTTKIKADIQTFLISQSISLKQNDQQAFERDYEKIKQLNINFLSLIEYCQEQTQNEKLEIHNIQEQNEMLNEQILHWNQCQDLKAKIEQLKSNNAKSLQRIRANQRENQRIGAQIEGQIELKSESKLREAVARQNRRMERAQVTLTESLRLIKQAVGNLTSAQSISFDTY